MATVTASRGYETPPEAVRSAVLADIYEFIAASGFDSVTVEGDRYTVSRRIGVATLELTLERVETDQLLEFDQVDGIFDTMWTEYRLEGTTSGCELLARTEFELGGVLGPVLDNTMIRRQRRNEFTGQFEYVAEAVE
ncbi:MAG: hypothetical protein ABEJ60_02390 [Halodesulfurarchaeum sp.]